MKRLLSGLLLLAGSGLAAGDGWISLFNGKDLSGWDGDPALWSVRDGVITGSSDNRKIERNTFLIYTARTFDDFELEAEVRLRNGNSGIQFRSAAEPGPGWVVNGYQADFSEAGERSAWGNFYEERGRGRGVMKTADEGWQRARPHVRHGDWNLIEVSARGPHIRVSLNGVETVTAHDTRSSSGVIAIQLHSGVPMQVDVRRIRVRPLRKETP